MATGKNKRVSAQLPGAPLTEVVFELRWSLQPAPPPLAQYDPMLIPMVQRFTDKMGKLGFPHRRDLVHPMQTGPHGVLCRFYRSPDSLFPIMQVGPGIFATNESAKYKWTPFRAQVVDGVRALLASYPTDLGAQLKPGYLELRYVDVFTKDIIGNSSFFEFAETGTTVTFSLPEFLKNRQMFWADPMGRFFYQRTLRERKDSSFAFDLSSAKSAETKDEIIQLVSRVSATGRGVPLLKTPGAFVVEVRKWLDFAHGVTSPFFKSFVKSEVMRKFQRRRP